MVAQMATNSAVWTDVYLVDRSAARKVVQMVDALVLFEAIALAVRTAFQQAGSTVRMLAEPKAASSGDKMVEYSGCRQVVKTGFGRAV